MYRGCRRLVCSLVCVFCILSMLFLDTCTVEAGSSSLSKSLSGTFQCSADTTWFSYNTTATNLIYPNAYYITGGQHFDIPVKFVFSQSDLSNVNFSLDRYYSAMIGAVNFNVSVGTVSNLCIKSSSGDLLWTNQVSWGSREYFSPSEIFNSSYTHLVWAGYISFDYVYTGTRNGSEGSQYSNGTWNFSASFYFEDIDAETYTKSNSTIVSNPTIENDTSEISDNTSGILSKITDFFGSFFENLIGIFVPEDGYFSGWFDRVNTLLSEKLGMLYAPFDLVISTLQSIYSSDSTESGIPFPGIKWEDTWLVEPFTFTFASLGSDFDDLRDKVYFATDTVLVLTFLMLLQSKVRLILEGHE